MATVECDAIQPEGRGTARTDLFRYRWIVSICRSRYFPFVLQTFTVVLFAVVLYDGFYGRQSRYENFAIVGPWVLLWPLTILSTLVLVGRVWCAVCPIGAIGAAFERVGQLRRFPNRLKKPALVLSLISFLFVIRTFGGALGIQTTPFASALFFTICLLAAVAMGLIFEGRPFCRYLCPITIPLNLYSRVAPFELRADPAVCKTCKTRDCVRGDRDVEGCPMGLYPATMDGGSDCIYCMKCVKACDLGSMKLRRRPFGSELVKVNKDGVLESVLSLAMVGGMYVMMSYMSVGRTLPDRLFAAVARLFASILSRPVDEEVLHISSTILWGTVALLLFALASVAAARVLGLRFKQAFSIFGPPFIIIPVIGSVFHTLIVVVLGNLGGSITYLASLIGVYSYHDPNIIGAATVKMAGNLNHLVNCGLGSFLTAITVYLVAKKVDQANALAATVPYVVFLGIVLFLVYDSRFASVGLPYL